MGQIKHKKCLLVTGTIIPNSNFVAGNNAEQRRDEYYDALKYYSSEFPEIPIYFLENSSFDFKTDKKFENLFTENKITLLKFPVSDKFEQGKGYQEFEMLDRAVNRLKGEYDLFIKITGRYKILNLSQILKLDTQNVIIDLHKKSKVAQTNMFSCGFDFYLKNLSGLYAKANDSKGVFIEHVVYEKLISPETNKLVKMLPVNPLIKGTSGSYGGTLNRNKYKMILRNAERKVLALLGIKRFLIEY